MDGMVCARISNCPNCFGNFAPTRTAWLHAGHGAPSSAHRRRGNDELIGNRPKKPYDGNDLAGAGGDLSPRVLAVVFSPCAHRLPRCTDEVQVSAMGAGRSRFPGSSLRVAGQLESPPPDWVPKIPSRRSAERLASLYISEALRALRPWPPLGHGKAKPRSREAVGFLRLSGSLRWPREKNLRRWCLPSGVSLSPRPPSAPPDFSAGEASANVRFRPRAEAVFAPVSGPRRGCFGFGRSHIIDPVRGRGTKPDSAPARSLRFEGVAPAAAM